MFLLVLIFTIVALLLIFLHEYVCACVHMEV